MSNDYRGDAHSEHFEVSQMLLGNPAFIAKMQGFDAPKVTLKCHRGHRLLEVEVMQHGGSLGMSGIQRLDLVTRNPDYFEPGQEVMSRADPGAENAPFQNVGCGRPGCSERPAPNRTTCGTHGALVSNAVAAIRQRISCPTCQKKSPKRSPDITLRQATILKLYGFAVITGKNSVRIEGEIRF